MLCNYVFVAELHCFSGSDKVLFEIIIYLKKKWFPPILAGTELQNGSRQLWREPICNPSVRFGDLIIYYSSIRT